jgi:Forkhead domain/FHA domain
MATQFANHYPQDMMGGLPNTGLVEPFPGALDILAGLTSSEQPYQYLDPYPASFPGMIDGLPAMQSDMDGLMIAPQPYLGPSPNIHDLPQHRISAFAKMEFEDGLFYITTYAIILGRDLAAHRAAVRREEEEKRIQEEGEAPKTPSRRYQGSRQAKSIVSESGGILRDGNDSDGEERAQRRRLKKASRASKASKKSKSTGSSSHHQSRRNSGAPPVNAPHIYQPQPQVRRSAPSIGDAAPLDPENFRPSPYECPTLGIHPPADAPASLYKNISRKHVKIKFNQKKHVWEAHFLGRNGGFVDGEFRPCQSVIPLHSGNVLQIGGVTARFVLPDVALGETGGDDMAPLEEGEEETYHRGGKQMSYEFEDAHGNGNLRDTSDEESGALGGRGEDGDDDEDEEGEGDESDGQDIGDEEDVDEDGEEEEVEHIGRSPGGVKNEEDVKNKADQPQLSLKPEKKRGPGRPPKNGIMSKREQREAKKAAELAAQSQSPQKLAKKTVPPAPGASTQVKNKVGRPRKHPRPEEPPEPREKRKYTKRKPKEPKDGEAKQEGSEDQAKEKKEKKPPKPPRSPSPVYREEDFTPEQLAKPNANYVTLIHEALSESATGQMSLPQIYRAIQRRYPYFVLKCGTNGWQSSVRHNLSQHHAFTKVERDGKGWMWAIVAGVSIEKEKKRRSSPPPSQHSGQMQQIYPHQIQGYPYGVGTMGPPAPGYHPMQPHLIQPSQPPAQLGQQIHMNGHMPPQGFHPPLNGIPHPGFQPVLPAQLNAPNNPQSYSSPYAPKAPPPNGPQPNDQHPPVEEKPHPPIHPTSVNPGPIQQPLPVPQLQQSQQAEQAQQPQVHAQAQAQQQSTSQSTQSLQPSPPVQPSQEQRVQQPHVPSPPEPPKYNDVVMRAVETFKSMLLNQMKGTNANAEELVNSAVNRVLGFATESTVPGDPHEAVLMSTLQKVLSSIAGSDFTSAPDQSNDHRSPAPQSQTVQESVSQPPVKVTGEKPTVMRPSFTGQSQSRPNGSSVPRPPMTTPGMVRTNSGGPANAPNRPSGSSASPAPAAAQGSPNGASTPKQSPKEPAQLAGQKRPLDDADDMREFKKLSTSGPPQLKT